jgi:hypothetical protein
MEGVEGKFWWFRREKSIVALSPFWSPALIHVENFGASEIINLGRYKS